MKLKIISKRIDFPNDMSVRSVNVKMFIKMVNLMVDKDIFAKDAVATLMSSLHRLSQVLI